MVRWIQKSDMCVHTRHPLRSLTLHALPPTRPSLFASVDPRSSLAGRRHKYHFSSLSGPCRCRMCCLLYLASRILCLLSYVPLPSFRLGLPVPYASLLLLYLSPLPSHTPPILRLPSCFWTQLSKHRIPVYSLFFVQSSSKTARCQEKIPLNLRPILTGRSSVHFTKPILKCTRSTFRHQTKVNAADGDVRPWI